MTVRRTLTTAFAMLVLSASQSVAGELSFEEFDSAVDALAVGDPSDVDPLAMNAAIVPSEAEVGDTVIAVLKIRMRPTWYIYAVVPPTQPFIEAEWIFNPGPGLEVVDDWAGPPTTLHKDLPNTRIHEAGPSDLVFFREMEVENAENEEAAVTVGLMYQICNPEYCLPPKTKRKTVKVSIASNSNEPS